MRCGQLPEPREPVPHDNAVVGDDKMQAIPTGPGLSEAEVATPPQGPRACRCEFAKPAPGIAAAANIAAAVPAASMLVVRSHLSRTLQIGAEDGKGGMG